MDRGGQISPIRGPGVSAPLKHPPSEKRNPQIPLRPSKQQRPGSLGVDQPEKARAVGGRARETTVRANNADAVGLIDPVRGGEARILLQRIGETPDAIYPHGAALILIRLQVETNYPGPCANASHSISIRGQSRQSSFQRLYHARHV